MKKTFLLSLGLLPMLTATAQEVTASAEKFWSEQMMPLHILAAAITVVFFLVLIVAIYMLRVLHIFINKAAEDKALALGNIYKKEDALWKRLWERFNALVPIEKEGTIELEHNFDGIKELDNHLPPWWKWLFIGTIAWSVVYLIIYHVTSSMPLSTQEYEEEVAIARDNIQKLKASQPVVSIDENALVFTSDATIIDNGKKIFIGNCASCHKENGAGGVGPNLTDEYWLHGGDVKNIYTTIKNGVPEKGMISWSTILKPDEMRDVAFYIMSMKGTKPLDAKAPQGELLKLEEIVLQDTSKVQVL